MFGTKRLGWQQEKPGSLIGDAVPTRDSGKFRAPKPRSAPHFIDYTDPAKQLKKDGHARATYFNRTQDAHNRLGMHIDMDSLDAHQKDTLFADWDFRYYVTGPGRRRREKAGGCQTSYQASTAYVPLHANRSLKDYQGHQVTNQVHDMPSLKTTASRVSALDTSPAGQLYTPYYSGRFHTEKPVKFGRTTQYF